MLREPIKKSHRTMIAVALFALWALIGYAVANQVIAARVAHELESDRLTLAERGVTISNNIKQVFGYVRGYTEILSELPDLMNPSKRDTLNRYLGDIAHHLDTDLIWVVDMNGTGVLSSKSRKKTTFIGKNFAERDYFKSAKAGQPGYQFTVGKFTGIPGVNFAEPIFKNGKIAGAVISKLNVAKLSPLLVEDGAMLTDDNGVVIIAKNPDFLFKALPGGRVLTMSAEEKMSHYRKTDFSVLNLVPAAAKAHAGVMKAGQPNWLYGRFEIGNEKSVLHLVRHLHYLETAARDKLTLAAEIGLLGFALTFAFIFLALSFLKDRNFRAIFDNSSVGIILLDEQLRFVETNHEFRRLLGYSSKELLGKTVLDLTAPEDRGVTAALRSSLVAGLDRLENYENRYLRKEGELVWTRVSTRRYLNWAGKVQLIAVVEDITAQKKAEDLLKEQEARMVASAKMSALGEMAAGIAHEINNPLAIINASAERLLFLSNEKALTDEKLSSISNKIITTSGRIAKIIAGLKSFSRGGELDAPIQVPVQTIIDDTLAFCLERLKRAEIELTISIEPKDLSIQCRPAQISQVLLNLLNNAHDALKGTKIRTIEIGAATTSGFAELWVRDSGPGIPPSLREKIMQPFFTTKDAGHGTGLGLSISRGIAASHGGIFFLDEQSAQTRFVLRLPLPARQDLPALNSRSA